MGVVREGRSRRSHRSHPSGRRSSARASARRSSRAWAGWCRRRWSERASERASALRKRAQSECSYCAPSSRRSARGRVRFFGARGTRPWSTRRVPGEHRKPSPPPCDAAYPRKSTRRGAAHMRCTAGRWHTARRRCTPDPCEYPCEHSTAPSRTNHTLGVPRTAVHCPPRPTQTVTSTRRSLACSAGGRSTVGAPYKQFKGEVYLSFTLLGTVVVPCEYPSVAAYARVLTSDARQPPAGAAGESYPVCEYPVSTRYIPPYHIVGHCSVWAPHYSRARPTNIPQIRPHAPAAVSPLR
jgi:hypothetical protein